MDDRTGHDLMSLAPEIDMTAARTAFARRRTQARRRRRAGSAALASLVVLAGAGIWSALPDDDGVTVDSGVATMPDGSGSTRPEPPETAANVDPSTTDPVTDPGPAIAPDGDCTRTTGSSPATFDPVGGIYAAHISAFDETSSTLTFDVVQWLTGDDAVAAYQHDEPGSTDGPPNDYYIVNESHAERTAPVAPDAAVALVRLATTGDVRPKPGTLAELPGYLAAGFDETVYWLTVSDGAITGICEQYRP